MQPLECLCYGARSSKPLPFVGFFGAKKMFDTVAHFFGPKNPTKGNSFKECAPQQRQSRGCIEIHQWENSTINKYRKIASTNARY